jgi:hypothetical protein
MGADSRITGTLLCRAGEGRVAFAAQEVASIESAETFGARAGSACQAFDEASCFERILVAATGEAVGVNALEIDAEPQSVLAPPALLQRMAGGSLKGFIQARGLLWPVMSLVEFGRYLEPGVVT